MPVLWWCCGVSGGCVNGVGVACGGVDVALFLGRAASRPPAASSSFQPHHTQATHPFHPHNPTHRPKQSAGRQARAGSRQASTSSSMAAVSNPPASASLLYQCLHTSTMPDDYMRWGFEEASKDAHSEETLGFWAMMAGKGQLVTLRTLVEEHGVWPNAVSPNDPDRLTALHLASSHGHLEVVRYLVLECGKKHRRRKRAATPKETQAVDKEEEEEHNHDQDDDDDCSHTSSSDGDDHGLSSATTAAAPPRPGLVDVDATLADGRTALHLAVKEKHEAVVLFLVREGKACVDSRDDKGRTPLMWACCLGMLECVRCLVLEGRADIGAKDADGNDVASIATSGGNVEVLSFLVHEAQAVDLEATDHNLAGARLLYIAARYGHLDMVRWLVEVGHTDVEARSTESGVMCHHAAAAYGHLSILQYLLTEGGAPLEGRTGEQMTALHVAAEEGLVEVCKWLVEEAGADMSAKDECGRRPKESARRWAQEAVITYFEKRERFQQMAKRKAHKSREDGGGGGGGGGGARAMDGKGEQGAKSAQQDTSGGAAGSSNSSSSTRGSSSGLSGSSDSHKQTAAGTGGGGVDEDDEAKYPISGALSQAYQGIVTPEDVQAFLHGQFRGLVCTLVMDERCLYVWPVIRAAAFGGMGTTQKVALVRRLFSKCRRHLESVNTIEKTSATLGILHDFVCAADEMEAKIVSRGGSVPPFEEDVPYEEEEYLLLPEYDHAPVDRAICEMILQHKQMPVYEEWRRMAEDPEYMRGHVTGLVDRVLDELLHIFYGHLRRLEEEAPVLGSFMEKLAPLSWRSSSTSGITPRKRLRLVCDVCRGVMMLGVGMPDKDTLVDVPKKLRLDYLRKTVMRWLTCVSHELPLFEAFLVRGYENFLETALPEVGEAVVAAIRQAETLERQRVLRNQRRREKQKRAKLRRAATAGATAAAEEEEEEEEARQLQEEEEEEEEAQQQQEQQAAAAAALATDGMDEEGGGGGGVEESKQSHIMADPLPAMASLSIGEDEGPAGEVPPAQPQPLSVVAPAAAQTAVAAPAAAAAVAAGGGGGGEEEEEVSFCEETFMLEECPDDLICPLSLGLLEDPVLAVRTHPPTHLISLSLYLLIHPTHPPLSSSRWTASPTQGNPSNNTSTGVRARGSLSSPP